MDISCEAKWIVFINILVVHVVIVHIEFILMRGIVIDRISPLSVIHVLNGPLYVPIGYLPLLIGNELMVFLECLLHCPHPLLMERLQCLTAVISQLGYCTLESRCLFEDFVNLVLGFDAEDLLQVIGRAGVYLGEERDLLALH